MMNEQWLTAMLMNNIGISLLEQRKYTSATRVFRSAMSVMKEQANDEESSPCDSNRVRDSGRMRMMIQKAVQEDVAPAIQLPPSHEESFLRKRLQVVDADDLAVAIRAQLKRDLETVQDESDDADNNKMYLIRFESSLVTNGRYHVAVVLHNAGIAFLMAAWAPQVTVHSPHDKHSGCYSLPTNNQRLQRLGAASRMFLHVFTNIENRPCLGQDRADMRLLMIITLQCLEFTSQFVTSRGSHPSPQGCSRPEEEANYYRNHRIAAEKEFQEFDSLCTFNAAKAA